MHSYYIFAGSFNSLLCEYEPTVMFPVNFLRQINKNGTGSGGSTLGPGGTGPPNRG